MTRSIHWAWIILAASFLSIFTTYSIRLSYGILMPEMILSLKISKAQAGAIASSFYLVYTLCTPVLGYLVDRTSGRRILAIFSLILGIGTFLMGKPQTLGEACVFFAIVGIGASAMWTPLVTLVQRWFVGKRRGMALGLLSISYAIGYGVMGLVLPVIVGHYGWRTCWHILAVLAFGLVPLNAILLRNDPAEVNARPWGDAPSPKTELREPGKEGKVPYRALLLLPNLWWGALSYLGIAFTAYVINTFIVTYGNMELGFPFARSALLASTIAFSGIAGACLLPILSDYWGRKPCLVLINAGMGMGCLLILWAGENWSGLLASVGFFGIFYGAVWPVFAAAAGDFFPPGTTGSVLGFWTIFYGIGLVLAPTLGGYFADRTGTFRWSFLMAGLAGMLSAWAFSRIGHLSRSG
jgi:sugar phosphate permease